MPEPVQQSKVHGFSSSPPRDLDIPRHTRKICPGRAETHPKVGQVRPLLSALCSDEEKRRESDAPGETRAPLP